MGRKKITQHGLMGNKFKDITNQRFGKLIAIKPTYKSKDGSKWYWLCRCDCGIEKHVLGSALTREVAAIRGCGCSSTRHKFKDNPEKAAILKLLREYKSAANNRNIKYDLTYEEFEFFIFQKCNYCNTEPKSIQKTYRRDISITYNGIDRVDNSKGYIIDNCVTCCKQCNRAKSNLTVEEFKEWVKNVYEFWTSKN